MNDYEDPRVRKLRADTAERPAPEASPTGKPPVKCRRCGASILIAIDATLHWASFDVTPVLAYDLRQRPDGDAEAVERGQPVYLLHRCRR